MGRSAVCTKTRVFQLFSLCMRFWRTILQPKFLHEKWVKTVEYVCGRSYKYEIGVWPNKAKFHFTVRRSQKQLTVAKFYALHLCPCVECSVITVVEFKVKKATGTFYDLLFRLSTILEKKCYKNDNDNQNISLIKVVHPSIYS